MASALASRSDAGTLIWNSCFKPSARVSVTCMASIFFPLASGLRGADIVNLVGARLENLRRWFGGPISSGELPLWRQVLQQSSCKRCQRLVRAEGLEPPQLSSLEPKSSASTSSATPADSIIVRPRCRGRRAYNMGAPVRSKKMAVFEPSGRSCGNWTSQAKNGPDRRHGRSNSPAGPTRAPGRFGRNRPRPGLACRSRPPRRGRRWRCRPSEGVDRLAAGRAGYADLVA